MCRSNAHGGRKCPSQNDPVKKAIHNAKRRAKYGAAKKGVILSEQELTFIAKMEETKVLKELNKEKNKTIDEISENVEHVEITGHAPTTEQEEQQVNNEPLPEPIVENSKKVEKTKKPANKPKTKKKQPEPKTISKDFLSYELNDKKQEELFKTDDKVVKKPALNIEVQENSGYLKDVGYFAPKTIKGTINYNKLTSQSYKQFGFSKPEKRTQDYRNTNRFDNDRADLVREASTNEVVNMTNVDKQAMTYFTTNNFKWLNNALYFPEQAKDLQEKNADDVKMFKADNPDNFNTDWYKEHESQETLKEVTKNLDKALLKGPKKQRIVYRGLSPSAPAFKDKDINDWFKEDIKLGTELKFDGYQSSTYNLDIALSYGSSDGVVFEILTPEGVNVTSISQYSTEYETILPRGARYMVVGKHDDFYSSSPWDDKEKIKTKLKVIQLVAINDKGEVLDGTNSTYEPELEI